MLRLRAKYYNKWRLNYLNSRKILLNLVFNSEVQHSNHSNSNFFLHKQNFSLLKTENLLPLKLNSKILFSNEDNSKDSNQNIKTPFMAFILFGFMTLCYSIKTVHCESSSSKNEKEICNYNILIQNLHK